MKTTKKVRPIASLQKFNQNETVNTLTIKGNTSLADLSIDRLGNVDLTLYSDPTKLSSITSISPLLTATTTGSSTTLSISTSELELLIHQIVEQQLKNIPAVAQGETVVEPDKDSEGDKVVESGSENNEVPVTEKSVEAEIKPVPVKEDVAN